ncbi:hypothetical protein BGW39_001523 [Mortierella sp. 14UC]|nr:hypothetical protein BGW39_001523 [Mortierella sp. 14UC]
MFTSATTTGTTTIHRHKATPPFRKQPSKPSHDFRTIASAILSASVPSPSSSSSSASATGIYSIYIYPKNHHNSHEEIYCYGCKQTKTRPDFSISQLNKMDATKGASKRVTRSGGTGRAVHQPLCKNCTPAEVTTLKCTHCARTRGLETFSKNQRRRQGDGHLVCLYCRKRLDAEGVVVCSDDENEDGGWNEEQVELYGYEGYDALIRGGHRRGEGKGGEMELEEVSEIEEGDPDWYNGTMHGMFL